MYKKDFEKWNLLKQTINKYNGNLLRIKEGEIWWCSIGVNIGNEIDGKNQLFERPVLVIKKFKNNSLMIVPLTTSEKVHQYHIPFTVNNTISNAVISQTRVISPNRLIRRMHKISTKKLIVIKNQVRSMI